MSKLLKTICYVAVISSAMLFSCAPKELGDFYTADYFITGSIVDKDNNPLTNIEVTCYPVNAAEPILTQIVNEDGKFKFIYFGSIIGNAKVVIKDVDSLAAYHFLTEEHNITFNASDCEKKKGNYRGKAAKDIKVELEFGEHIHEEE